MRLFIFILGVAAAVYMEPGADSLFHGWLLPLVAFLSLAYVFWLGGFVAIVIGVLAFTHIDLGSDSLLYALLLPAVLGLSVVYLLWWAVPGGGLVDGWGELGGCDGGDGGGGDCGGGD